MKNLLFFFLLSIFNFGNAQSYNGPESVEYDSINGEYYISNSSNGQILKWDGVALNLFVSNIGPGPHGLEIVNNTLYACSGGRLKGFDLIDGTEVLDYNLNGSFLNGISHYNEDLYISDFSAKRLYKYDLLNNTHELVCTFQKTPNGVYYDEINERLLVVCWGNNAPIYEVNLSMSSYTSILNTGLGNLDGITMDDCGFFYVSAWSNNSIYRYSPDFTDVQQVVSSLSHPADICYNQSEHVLAVPNSLNNTVDYLTLDLCSPNTSLNEVLVHKRIIETKDLLGRSTDPLLFTPLIDVYDDGSVQKRIIVE